MSFDPDKYLEKKRQSEPFDPDKYLASKQPESFAKSLGAAFTSAADTALNMITGAAEQINYPFARAYYGMKMSPEEAARKAQQVTTLPKDILGRATGLQTSPTYQEEASRRGTQAIGEMIEPVVKTAAETTGLPEQDVASVLGSLTAAATPAVTKAVKPIVPKLVEAGQVAGQAAQALAKAPVQIPRGLYEGITKKQYDPATSAMVPLREYYYPQGAVERFMGRMPGVEPQTLKELMEQQRPTSEIINTPMARAAKAISPTTAAGETLVPYAGKGMQAFGERVGRGIRTNPLQAMGEVGLTALTGIPFKTLAQGIGELGSAYLGKKTGFVEGFPEAISRPQAIQSLFAPEALQLGYNPNPVIPAGGPPRAVNIEGQRSNLPYADVSQAQTARPPSGPSIPVPDITQLAQQRTAQIAQQSGSPIQQVAAQKVVPSGNAQSILDMIRARNKEQSTSVPTNIETPSTGSLFEPQNFNRLSPEEKLQALRQRVKQEPQPAMTVKEEAQYQKQLNNKSLQVADVERQIQELVSGSSLGKETLSTASETGRLTPIDYTDLDNATKGMAKALEKAGISELPVEIPGVITTNQIIRKAFDELKGKKAPKAPSNVSQMMLERDPNYERFTIKMPDEIKKGMDTKEATAAMLSGKGEWLANNYKYKMEDVAGGQTRLQVRKDNQVVYERYY